MLAIRRPRPEKAIIVRSPVGSDLLVEFFSEFFSTARQTSGKFRTQPSPDIIGYHNQHNSFITGANDMGC